MNFDLQSATLSLLVVIGAVNVLTMYKPDLDSRFKFGVSVAIAFALSFIPAEIGVLLADKLKDAITVALAASGGYKLFQVAGQKS